MDKKQQTAENYNKGAESFAKKFDDLGARVSDIKEMFEIVNKNNPKVLEIGCVNGRDAKEVLKYTSDYLGIDISGELIKIARRNIPQANFQIADAETFEFPANLDIIFAFASLIHVNKKNLKNILEKSFHSLNHSGIIWLSMKYAENYKEITKEDEFGKRTFYFYSDKDITEIAGKFSIIKDEIHDVRGQKWLDIVLQKN